ncbi:MAG TPA: YkgJ family cysteine cluster protein [Acidobacteriaceae bacterium]|jgi:Fe-S-cluster containining protein
MEPEQDQPPPIVDVNFTLQIGKGQLQASAQVPSGNVNLGALLPILHGLSSAIIDATVNQVREEGFAISCKAGCGACCRQLVPLSMFEADQLAAWIRSLPPTQQAVIEARFDAAIARLKESGMLDRLDFEGGSQPGSKEERQLALDYMHAGVPCPFLENESCGIHPIRPAVCREYLVTSPAQFCASPTAQTVKPVRIPLKLSTALNKLGGAVTSVQRGWIPLVFLYGWLRSGRDVSSAYQGPGPELLRVVFEQLETPSEAAPDEHPAQA